MLRLDQPLQRGARDARRPEVDEHAGGDRRAARQDGRGNHRMKKIKIRLLKSTAGCRQSHRDTVRGLGLRRINHVVELADTPAVRGMVNKVNYLVRIEA